MLVKEQDAQKTFEWLENLDVPAVVLDITGPEILYTNKQCNLLTTRYPELGLL